MTRNLRAKDDNDNEISTLDKRVTKGKSDGILTKDIGFKKKRLTT
jgi:hypothetical protein